MNDTVRLVLVGWLVLVASLAAELVGSLLVGLTGLVPPNATGSAWFYGLTAMMVIAAPLMLVVSWAAAYRFMKPNTAAEGWPIGAVWAGMVAFTHVLIGLGNATLGMFTSPGTWLMFAGVLAGPWLAGRQREHRTQTPGAA